MPGMISRPTSIPSMGNLQELYPETFGGVSTSHLLCIVFLTLIVHDISSVIHVPSVVGDMQSAIVQTASSVA